MSRSDPIPPAVAALLAEVTAIPFKASDTAWTGLPILPYTGKAGRPLIAGGKPEVFYVGTEYCPYCATETWAMLIALGRFGTFADVNEIRSARYPPYPPLDSWTFYGSSYSSRYLTFVPVETYSNVLVSPGANPLDGASYRPLQELTPAQRAVMKEADKPGATPFTDFGGRAAWISAQIYPQPLEHVTWSQLISALRARRGTAAQTIIAAADYFTAELCQLTRYRPATACPASIKVFRVPVNPYPF